MLVLKNSVFSTNEILFMILTYIRLGFASARFRKISNFFTGVAFLFRAGLCWLKCSLPSHLEHKFLPLVNVHISFSFF